MQSPTQLTTPLDPAATAATSATVEGSSVSIEQDAPETITGDKIGDRVDPTRNVPGAGPDGIVNVADVPAWVSVSQDGRVVGYAKKADLYSSPSNPSEVQPAEPIPVYDNERFQVGVLGPNGFIRSGEGPAVMSVPPPDISADLEQPLCRDLASLLDGLVQAPLVPIGARTVGDPNGACEILYAIPPESPEIIIGSIPKPASGHNDYPTSQRTEDADETSVHWDTGSIAYIDPTGLDLLDLSTDAHVIVERVDGSRLYVATYGYDDESFAVGIAQAFDNRLG